LKLELSSIIRPRLGALALVLPRRENVLDNR